MTSPEPEGHWTDLFCPWNQDRRKSVLRMSSKITTLLEADFRKTNELIRCIHENLPGKTFTPVNIHYTTSVSENCLELRKCLHELDEYLCTKRAQLAGLMGVDLFNELMSPNTSFQNKIKAARKSPKNAIMSIGNVPGMVIISLLSEENCISCLNGGVFAVSNCAFGTMDYDTLGEGPDSLLKLLTNKDAGFIGNMMGHGVDENLADIEGTLDKFEPASDRFTRTVDRVLVRIDG